MMRRKLAGIAAVAAITTAGLAAATPADAATIRGGHVTAPGSRVTTLAAQSGGVGYVNVVQYATGHCLDGNGAGSVYASACGPSDNPYQRWNIYGDNTGYFTVVQYATGRCLDSNGAGSVYTSVCGPADNPYQHWKAGPFTGASFQNVATGRLLDGNGSSVYTSVPANSDNPYQIWTNRF
ncbi:RICIN domain-containing protein [Embleya sp. AB8]|uniref:RICIN domain-containing protein n=1 Tax=Embleya sp. AB8 TaxID=3156304 RepID=UPI003C754B88